MTSQEKTRVLRRLLATLAVGLTFWGAKARASVDGTLPQPFRTFRVFGNAIATGNTLMRNSATAPQVNTSLLASSSANVSGIPSDARIVSAILWWSGSINNDPNIGPTGIDTTADLDLPDGTHFEDIPATACLTSSAFNGFFYCHADVTDIVDGSSTKNGLYTVGEVIAQPGKTLLNSAACDPSDPACQSRYAGWSIIIVFDSPSQPTQRDIIIFDGFVSFDEDNTSGLVPPIQVSGFEVGAPGLAEFSFFAMEGDAHLGIPPQNLKNQNAFLFCTTCRDFIDVETPTTPRTPLQDAFNEPGNIFNSTVPSGFSLGIDIDTYNVGVGGLEIFDIGNTSATIFVGSGDGVIEPGTTHGGGEAVFLGWMLITLTRPSPRFAAPNTRKVVDFTTAAPGQILTYTINVANDGDQVANNVIVRDSIPAQTTYVPGSTRVGGVAVPDVAGTSPVASAGGLNLGTLAPISQGGGTQTITFQVRINTDASGQITNSATVGSDEINPPFPTNTVTTEIDVPVLGIPEKRVTDLTAPIGEFRPGDLVSYTVTLRGSPDSPVGGLQFVDDMPAFLQLVDVTEPGGSTDNSIVNGGINGTGRVDVSNISIAQNGTTNISIIARVFSEAEFNAAGISTDQIDGRVISNQGQILADFLPTPTCTGDAATSDPQCTDDPTTGPTPDATRFTLRFAPDLSTSAKLVTDENGGPLEPGDVIRYTVRLRNTGNLAANITVTDDLPAGVDGSTFTVVSDAGATINFAAPPAGANGTGSFTATALAVPPGATREIVFTVLVDSNAANGTQVTNTALAAVENFPSEDVTLTSPTLTVFATPDLGGTTKAVVDLNGGNVRPSDVLEYTITIPNTGNRDATSVVVTDVIDADVTVDVASITAGGVFDAATRTITWNLGTLSPGTQAILTYQVQVNHPLADGTEIRNQAEIESAELGLTLSDDPSTAAPDDPTIRIVTSAPDFTAATKTITDLNGGDLRPGDVVSFTLEATNQGDSPATGVVFQDVVEENLINVVPQDGGVFDAATRTITWTIPGTINPGETRQVSFTAEVASPLAPGTVICNQGSIGSAQTEPVLTDDPTTATVDDATCREVVSEAILTFTKEFADQTGGETIPGDQVRYTLTLNNEGDAPATGIVITDVVSDNLVNIVPSAPGVFDPGTRTITWNIAEPLLPGTPLVVTFDAQIRFPLADGTVICNQATGDSDESAAVESDDPATAEVAGDATCVTVVSAPDLGTSTKAFTDENGGDPRPGDIITYTITVKNTGTEDATNLTITDPIDPNLTVVAGSISDGGVFNAAENRVEWSLASLAAGEEKALTFQAQIALPLDNGTLIANQAEIDADRVSPILTDDAATPPPPNEDDPTVFTVVSAPDFSTTTKVVTDINGGLHLPGDTLLYTITVKNTGDMIGRRTTVTDVVDTTNLENIVPGEGGIFDAATGTITWNAATTPQLANIDLSPAGDVVLTFQAQIRQDVADGTEIANQAQISHEDPNRSFLSDDPTTAAPGDPTIIVVGIPNFEDFTKSVAVQDGGAPEPLKTLVYTLTIRNTGTAPATNVTVIDPVDTVLLEQVTPGQGGVFAGNNIRWDGATTPELAVLDPDETVVLTFTAVIRATVANGEVIENQATLSFAELAETELSDDPATADPDDPTRIIVSAIPDFSFFNKEVSEDGGAPPFAPGDTILYTLTFRNDGAGFARNVVVTDVLPAELTNVIPGQGGLFDEATRTVTWNATTTPELATVNVGTEIVLTIQAQIVSPLANQTLVSNQASIQDDFSPGVFLSDDPTTAAIDDPTVFEVVSAPLFVRSPKVAVDVNGGLLLAGDNIRYTIRVVNSGTEASSGTILVDAIPAQTTYLPGSTTLNGVPVPDVGGQSALVDGLLVNSPGSPAGVVLVGEENAAEVSFLVRVDETAVQGTIISNQGFISAQNVSATPTDDPAVGGDADPTQLVVGEAPNLTNASKDFALVFDQDDDGQVDIGDRIAFTIEVTNLGSDTATGVVITDPIPSENALYAPGTLTLNGLPLSDVADDDDGEVLNNFLTVRVGSLAPGETALVRFEVDVINGPAIFNQGSVDSDQTAPELTDSDGDDQNGDQPTVVPVGDDQVALLLVSKAVEDINGGALNTGDIARYRVTVQNVGTASADITLTDALPQGVEFLDFTDVPAGAQATFAPPPAGNGNGLIRVDGFSLESGETALLSFEVRVTAKEATEVCNTAVVSFPKAEPVSSEPICFLVGTAPGTGGFAGRVFQDFGVDNRVFDEDVDLALAGFEVRVFSASDPGVQVASAVVTPDGTYQVLGLIPGDYVARVFSEEGVLFGTGAVSVADGAVTDLALPVDPTGVVYESTTGRAIAGARVFLFFDDEDLFAPGELVPESDLGEGQQGQRTGRLGLYLFDAPEGRKYRVSIQPPGATQIFPSVLIAPQPGFAVVGIEDEVVADDVPDLTDDAPETYFLRFDLERGVSVKNNHIPLDPLRALLILDKKSFDTVARTGEIVTYQIKVENRSGKEIGPNDEGRGGLTIEDALPKGFRFLDSSPRLERVTGASREREDFPENSLDTAGRLVSFRNLRIGAGETLILTYQVAIRMDVPPGIFENTAQGFIDSVPATEPDTAKVRVELDPDFAESVLIGKVFCDDDQDGWQDLGEIGIPYARIYLDTGTYVETDAFGKYHVTGLPPGMHLAKIDVNTLPPPGKLTTKAGVLFHATSSLLQKANFGAVCSFETAGIDRIVTYAEGFGATSLPTKTLPEPKSATLVISGDVNTPRILVDSEALSLPSPSVSLGAGGPVEVASFDRPYSLKFTASAEGASSWWLRVWSEEGEEILTETSGDGPPPAEIPLEVKKIAEGVYRFQLFVTAGDHVVASPVGSFLVGAGDKGREVFSLAQGKSALFSTKGNAPSRALLDAIKKASLSAPAAGEVFKIEVYHDGSVKGARALDLTQKRADALKATLAKDLSIPEEAIFAVGMGSVSTKVRAADRKVVIRALPAAPAPVDASALPAYEAAPFAYVGEQPVMVASDGSFARALDKAKLKNELIIDIGAADGRRVTALVTLRETEEPEYGEGAAVEGDLATRTVTVDGKPYDLSLLGLDLKVGPRVSARASSLSKPIVLMPILPESVEITRWRIRIVEGSGKDLAFLEGEGAPPASLSWDGMDSDGNFVVKGGGYFFALLDVEASSGMLAESVPRLVHILGSKKTPRYPSFTRKGESFDASDKPNAYLSSRLKHLAKRISKQADQFYEIGVEVPLSPDDPSAREKALARAAAVQDELVKLGVPAASLRLRGGGSPKFKEGLSKTQLALLNNLWIWRIAPVEAAARESGVLLDGEALTLSGSSFSGRFGGDGGLIDIRDFAGSRLILPVAAPREVKKPSSASERFLLEMDESGDSPSSAPTSEAESTSAPASAPASMPIDKDGIINPFAPEGSAPQAPSPQPSVSLDIFLPLGAGGDVPAPKRRSNAESEKTKGQKVPAPRRRTEEEEGKKPKASAIPAPNRRKETGKPAGNGGANKTRSTPEPAPAVKATATDPSLAAEEPPLMPAIGAPISSLPEGTAASQPVEAPENPDYASFGKKEIEALASLEAKKAELRAQGLDPETVLKERVEAITASTLTVLLPPQGVVLRGGRLVIQGDTDPKNKIRINGQAIPVDENGHFLAKLQLKSGENELVLEAEDPDGNVAEVRRPVTVDPATYFVLALGDLAFGDADAVIPAESTVHNTTQLGPVFIQGRAALYFKGHIPGKLLFDAYDITAHIDTARRAEFENFFDNVIDPEKYYPVYGDASQEVREAATRGPLYVLIEADESKLRIGSVKAALQGEGVELFRYERTLYGIEVDFKKPYGKEDKIKTQLKAFVSQDDKSLHRVHNVFRGTGGSVYALSETDLLEGAEKIRVVVRDPATGAELFSVPLRRYDDYVIDYRGGRVSLRDPLPSVVDATFLLGHAGMSAALLEGAPVFLEVDFESEAEGAADARVAGGYARQTFGKVSIGAGYVEEVRTNAPHYRLFGADIQAKWAERTYLKAEYAQSGSIDAPTFASPDGGLTFQPIGIGDAGASGGAFKVSGAFELADVTGKVGEDGKPAEQFSITGYAQILEPGFFANGTIFDQGQTKGGLQAKLPFGKGAKLVARVDTLQSLPSEANPLTLTNTLASLGIEKEFTRNTWRGDISYLYSDDSNPDADPLTRAALSAGLERKLSSRWTFLLFQEAVLYDEGESSLLSPNPTGLSQSPAGNALGQTADGKIIDSSLDSFAERMTTTAGLRLKLSDDLTLSLVEALRWDGSNATLLSVKTKLSEGLSAYVTERFQLKEGDPLSTTIVGAEQRFGNDGRSYGEYHLESAASGLSERAVLGIGKRWRIKEGLGVSLAYEHVQFVSGVLQDDRTPVSRDAAAGGIEWLVKKNIKASAKLELRYDNGTPSALGGTENDRLQTVAAAGITYRLTPDWTLFARALDTTTRNVSTQTPEIWDRLATFGFAYRPELKDRFNMLGKFSVVSRKKPTDLAAGLFDQEEFIALSIAPVWELSKRFGVATKFALRSETRLFEDLDPQVLTTMLIAARLNIHFSARWDLGLEWRGRQQQGAISAQESGFLGEVALRLSKYMSMGVGYNFTSFSDDELVTDDKNAGGLFFRVTGQY